MGNLYTKLLNKYLFDCIVLDLSDSDIKILDLNGYNKLKKLNCSNNIKIKKII